MKKLDLVYRVSIITIIINFILFIFKLVAGIIGNSKAMVSDAMHSASDIVSTIIVMIGIFVSRKKSDEKHPYGHEKFECIAAIVLAIMLFIVGLGIGVDGINSIVNYSYKVSSYRGVIALIAAIVSIVVKEWMYHFTMRTAKKENSDSLKADAWHHRSDSLSSIGALIGIGGAMVGITILDSVASILIALCIIKASFDILKDGIDKMVDTSASIEIIELIKHITYENESVKNIDSMKTRLFGSKIFIDLEIALDKNLSFVEAHSIAHSIHDAIESNIKNCKHCMVHINPYDEQIKKSC